jgi:hypothetical protein
MPSPGSNAHVVKGGRSSMQASRPLTEKVTVLIFGISEAGSIATSIRVLPLTITSGPGAVIRSAGPCFASVVAVNKATATSAARLGAFDGFRDSVGFNTYRAPSPCRDPLPSSIGTSGPSVVNKARYNSTRSLVRAST